MKKKNICNAYRIDVNMISFLYFFLFSFLLSLAPSLFSSSSCYRFGCCVYGGWWVEWYEAHSKWDNKENEIILGSGKNRHEPLDEKCCMLGTGRCALMPRERSGLGNKKNAEGPCRKWKINVSGIWMWPRPILLYFALICISVICAGILRKGMKRATE